MTDRNTQLGFDGILQKQISVTFDGGALTSDTGAIPLSVLDRQLDLSRRLAGCLEDKRDSTRVRHSLRDLVCQRMLQICLGYEDANDANALRVDPALKIAVGRPPASGADLASQPTLSRFENAVSRKQLFRLSRVIESVYFDRRPEPDQQIIIDIDASDDPTHGQQAFAFYHGYYRHHMLHPLFIFDGETGDLMASVLRPGNVHSANGVLKHLKRLVRKIRRRWPWVKIIVRADAGFAVRRLYRYCEHRGIGYILGLGTNQVLKRLHAPLLDKALKLHEQGDGKVRLIGETRYGAKSWKRNRRVIMKAEVMPQGTNRRFVVTNLEGDPEQLYDFYVKRGDAENRIKDLKNALKADRLSCSRFEANCFRLLLHSAAYVLMHQLRLKLHGTELERAQFDTIRIKLLKVGARVSESCRRVWIRAASSYPYQEIWLLLHRRLISPAPS